MSPSTLLLSRTTDTLALKIDGRVTMTQSVPLRRLAEDALAAGVPRLLIDLRCCTYIDSTFVGTLLVLQRAAAGHADFALISPALECRKTFESLGLARRFPIVDAVEEFDALWQCVDVSSDDRDRLKFNVCESHEELVNIGGATAAPFRGIAQTMRRELDALPISRENGGRPG